MINIVGNVLSRTTKHIDGVLVARQRQLYGCDGDTSWVQLAVSIDHAGVPFSGH